MTNGREDPTVLGRHRAIAAACAGASGGALILSANPMHDTGGGQRSAQLALELLARDFAVVFVSHGRVTETTSLGISFQQPRLVEMTLAEVDARRAETLLGPLFDQDPSLVVTQVPVRAWLPVLEAAHRRGAATIYDCIDRWDSELGRGWYESSAEREVAEASSLHVASAPDLVEHVEHLSGRRTHWMPNAFNARLFDPTRTFARPRDLPDAETVAIYVGALWGGWMDWRLVRRAAEAYPETAFVFVGDRRREGRGLPHNCHFLGLKRQAELPPYLEAADVAVLPWKVEPVTQSTSPLKVYEFVAMNLPVVAPSLEPLRGIPGVETCSKEAAFLEAIGRVRRDALAPEARRAMHGFSANNSWARRVDDLLDSVRSTRATGNQTSRTARRVTGSTLSVVIPAYNHEAYVGAAIESVWTQTLPASELVVVDDGSSDRTPDVLAKHAHPLLTVIGQANRGAHRAINRAIALSRGEWVAILNSDDLFEPGRLEQAWGVARATRAALVLGSVRLIDEHGDEPDPDHAIARWYREARRTAQSGRPLGSILRRHNIAVTTSNFFMHRELWRALGGFRAYRYVHDLDFLLRAVALCPGRVRYVDALCGVRYRIHGANTIGEEGERAAAERREMLAEVDGLGRRIRRRVARGPGRRAVLRGVEQSDALAIGSSAPSAVLADRAEPLRVGIAVRSLGRGGLEEVVALLAQTLPEHGALTSVLCTHTGGSVADRLERAGIRVTIADGRKEAWHRWLRDERLHIVSSHFAPTDALAELARSGVPIVETIQNTYAWFSEGEWDEERTKSRVLAERIAVSDVASEYYARRVGTRPGHVIPNAVHPGRVARVPRAFARDRLSLPAAAPVFVSVGRITEQKNVGGLLAAFAGVVETVPEARLVLAGPDDGSTPLRRLRATHRKLFANGSVRHAGVFDDVGLLLSAAEAFVSNAFYEGWSVAASEAAWVGLPLVLSDAGANRRLVGDDDERGRLVPNPLGSPFDVDKASLAAPPRAALDANREAMTRAMIDVASDRDGWLARAEATRVYARETLAPRVIAASYARALTEIRASHAPAT